MPAPLQAATRDGALPLAPERRIAFATDEGTGLQPDLSPDGRWIAFALLGDIYLLSAQGGEARALTRGMAVDTQPVFSPDGKSIAFLSDRSGAENLWVMNADGGNPRQLSDYDDDPVFVSPAWSADDSVLFVSRYWPDRNAYELWRFASHETGKGVVHLANRPPGDATLHHALGASASRDGRFLYHASRKGELDLAEPVEWRIARTDLATGQSEDIVKSIGDIRLGPTQSSAFGPAISHDGKLLAYAQRRADKTWLRLRDLASTSERDLIDLDPDSLQASYWSDIAPRIAFAPGGEAVVTARGGKIVRVALRDGAVTTIPFTAQVEAGLGPLARAPTRIETGAVRARIIQAPSLSPDGSTFAFSALGRIYLMPATGGEVRPLANGTPPQFHPSWSSDSRSVLFVTWTAEGGGQVWRADAGSGAVQQLTRQHAFYTHPVFAPDGGVIAVRSPTDARLSSYVEFGQFREAQLVRLPGAGEADGAVLASGSIGGTPHFLADGTLLVNRPDGLYRVAGNAKFVSVAGPNWYFAEGPAQADDLRASPDGKWALAQIAQQLHLVGLSGDNSQAIDLTKPEGRHERISASGADFFGWSADGSTLWWSLGSTLYRRALTGGAVASAEAVVSLPRDRPKGTVLLSGATVLTMGPQGTITDADILVRDDRIAAIGLRGTIAVPAGTGRHDISERFVIPGLVDAHDHVADIRRDVLDFAAWGPAANLAYGVTTAFDPSTLTIDMLAYQDAIDAGLTPGSRIISTGPAVFSFNRFRSEAEVDAVLRRYRDHYRLSNIKMYRSGNRRTRQWIAQVARRLGLHPTTEGALALKLDVSHILDGFAGNEHAIAPPRHYRDITELLARSGTSYDLTLQITHGGYPAQDFFIARDQPLGLAKYARFAPPWFREQKFATRQWRDPSTYRFAEIAASAGRFAAAGGLLAIGAHGEVPGLGTHWEMQAHAMGGMAPEAILHAATIGGARAIGREADLGSLEAGKLADLVILTSDPRETVANALAISEVMKGGRLYDGNTLAQLWPIACPAPRYWFSTGDPPAGGCRMDPRSSD